MTTLRFAGLPAGSADLTVTQGGRSSSAATTIPTPPTDPTGVVHYLKNSAVASNWRGVSATLVGGHGLSEWGWGPAPYRHTKICKAVQVDGRKIDVGLVDSEFRAALFIGGRAQVYRVVDGVMTLIRDSVVSGGDFSAWHKLLASDKGVSQANGYERQLQTYNDPGTTYYFGVAALKTGQIGAVGYDSYAPSGGAWGGGDAQSNSEDTVGAWTTGGGLAAPANVTATADGSGNQLVAVSWDSVATAESYIPLISYTDPTTHPAFPYIELADDGGAAVLANDMVIVSRLITDPSTDILSPRTWGVTSQALQVGSAIVYDRVNQRSGQSWAYRAWGSGDEAPATLGDYYARFAIDAGQTTETLLISYWNGSSSQTYYDVLDATKTYVFSFWVRASRAIDLTVKTGLYGVSDQTVSATTSWQQITLSHSPTATRPSGLGAWEIRAGTSAAAAVDLDIAGFSLVETGQRIGALQTDTAAQVVAGMVLRDHNLIKGGPALYDADDLTNAAGLTQRGATLESFLRQCDDVSAEPWIQLEWAMPIEDWLDVLAYLKAPVSSGHAMALKRQANGRTEPWADAFTNIRIEFGNEAWNTLSGFWNAPSYMVDSVTAGSVSTGTAYGLIARRIALALEASEYWDSKISWVLGGWSSSPSFTGAAVEAFNRPCEAGIANYNGGWDETDSLVGEDDTSYQSVMAVVPGQTARRMDSLVTRLGEAATASDLTYGVDLFATCYEAGPGFQQDGLNGAKVTSAESAIQEVVMKSRASATGTLHTALEQAVKGFALFNFFTLGSGNTWTSHAPASAGGGVYPPWSVVRVLQSEMGPSAVYEARTVRADAGFSMTDSDDATITPAGIFVYALRSLATAGRWMLVVGNISRTATTKPTICTPWASASGCTVWSNTGDYREHNRYPVGTRIVSDAPQVDGAGQTGTTLVVKRCAFLPAADDTLTIPGVTGSRTVASVAGFGAGGGTITLTGALTDAPADGAEITFDSVTDGYAPDANCVEIDMVGVSKTVPADMGRLVIDAGLGATASGLAPGTCVLVRFDGVG